MSECGQVASVVAIVVGFVYSLLMAHTDGSERCSICLTLVDIYEIVWRGGLTGPIAICIDCDREGDRYEVPKVDDQI